MNILINKKPNGLQNILLAGKLLAPASGFSAYHPLINK
jgi:hypothetical protein